MSARCLLFAPTASPVCYRLTSVIAARDHFPAEIDRASTQAKPCALGVLALPARRARGLPRASHFDSSHRAACDLPHLVLPASVRPSPRSRIDQARHEGTRTAGIRDSGRSIFSTARLLSIRASQLHKRTPSICIVLIGYPTLSICPTPHRSSRQDFGYFIHDDREDQRLPKSRCARAHA
jgi:hypothetical protein